MQLEISRIKVIKNKKQNRQGTPLQQGAYLGRQGAIARK